MIDENKKSYQLDKLLFVNIISLFVIWSKIKTKFRKSKARTSKIQICILGIGDYGKTEDANILLKYLENSEEEIVKNRFKSKKKY